MFEGWGAAVVGASVVGGIAKAGAAKKAAGSQKDAADAGIDAENRRFDEAKELLSPYVEAGKGSLTAQQDLLGLNGADAQKAAISGVEGSPQFAALTQQGENSILQNASATGGLRGGNTQAALAQYRPALLASLIDQQYSRLGGITQIGQNSAAFTGSAGMNNGTNVANLLGSKGAADAGKYLTYGSAVQGVANSVGGVAMAGGKVF